MATPRILLVDNGSLAPAATLRLRELAAALAGNIGRAVEPVSLLHASGVPAEQLGGQPAEILEPALARRVEQGTADFVVVPLFFGPSAALTEYLPGRVAFLRQRHPALRVRVAPVLFDPADRRLARILADQVRAARENLPAGFAGVPTRVALVDHGSPSPAVAVVRDQLAVQLAALLGAEFVVAPCSMERREGPAYDFSGPLLATLLARPDWNSGEVIVALQFLLPGRHAGPDGDVATICREAGSRTGGALRTRLTGLVGEHPLLIDILADRCRAAIEA